jgi:hypothetical protein
MHKPSKVNSNAVQTNVCTASYLAGLVEGDGHFSNQKQIIIVFSQKDYGLAVTLKKNPWLW